MRAISLWEPWGTAIAKGLKKIETRHWATDYRGLLAIHCAKITKPALEVFTRGALCDEGPIHVMLCALNRAGVTLESLNHGKVVCVCRLSACLPTEEICKNHWLRLTPTERAFGNYDPGRFGWILEDVRPLAKPVPFRGAQGFFNVPDSLLA